MSGRLEFASPKEPLRKEAESLSISLWKEFANISELFSENIFNLVDPFWDVFKAIKNAVLGVNNKELNPINLAESYDDRVKRDKENFNRLMLETLLHEKTIGHHQDLTELFKRWELGHIDELNQYVVHRDKKIKELQKKENGSAKSEIEILQSEIDLVKPWQLNFANLSIYIDIYHLILEQRYYLAIIGEYNSDLNQDLDFILKQHANFSKKCEFILDSKMHSQVIADLDEFAFAVIHSFSRKGEGWFEEEGEKYSRSTKIIGSKQAKLISSAIINGILSAQYINHLSNCITQIDNLNLPLLKLEQAVVGEVIAVHHQASSRLSQLMNGMLSKHLSIQNIFNDWMLVYKINKSKFLNCLPFVVLITQAGEEEVAFDVIIESKLRSISANFSTKKKIESIIKSVNSTIEYSSFKEIKKSLKRLSMQFFDCQDENSLQEYTEKFKSFVDISKHYVARYNPGLQDQLSTVTAFIEQFKEKLDTCFSLKTNALTAMSSIQRSLMLAIDFHAKLKGPTAFFVEYWPDISLYVLGNAMLGLLSEKALRIYTGHQDDNLSLLDFAIITMLLTGLVPVGFVMMVRWCCSKNQLKLYDEEAALQFDDVNPIDESANQDIQEIKKVLLENASLRNSIGVEMNDNENKLEESKTLMQKTTEGLVNAASTTLGYATSMLSGGYYYTKQVVLLPVAIFSYFTTKPPTQSSKVEEVPENVIKSSKLEDKKESTNQNKNEEQPSHDVDVIKTHDQWHTRLKTLFASIFSDEFFKEHFNELNKNGIDILRNPKSLVTTTMKTEEIRRYVLNLLKAVDTQFNDDYSSEQNNKSVSPEMELKKQLYINLLSLITRLILLEKYLIRFDYLVQQEDNPQQLKLMLQEWSVLSYLSQQGADDCDTSSLYIKQLIYQIYTIIKQDGWHCRYNLEQVNGDINHPQSQSIREYFNEKIPTVKKLLVAIADPDNEENEADLFSQLKIKLNNSIDAYLSTADQRLEKLHFYREDISKFHDQYHQHLFKSADDYFHIFDMICGKMTEPTKGICFEIDATLNLIRTNLKSYAILGQFKLKEEDHAIFNELEEQVKSIESTMRDYRGAFQIQSLDRIDSFSLISQMKTSQQALTHQYDQAVLFSRCLTDFFTNISAAISAAKKLNSPSGFLSYVTHFIPKHWTAFFFGGSGSAFLGTLLLKHLQFEDDFTNFGKFTGGGAGAGVLMVALVLVLKDLACKPSPPQVSALLQHITFTNVTTFSNNRYQERTRRQLSKISHIPLKTIKNE